MDREILKIKNLYYKVREKEILRGINLLIKEGEIHAIIGVNGTGKTTLANVLMGLRGYNISKGEIFFKSKPINKISITKRARLGITLAWQIPANFEGISVREYLSFKQNSLTPEESLNLVGLNQFYLDRMLDENLSGGERKRIELASVLSIKPKFVILDEPDSGVDMPSMNTIKKIIKDFKKQGASVLLITHNEEIAKIADRVSVLCKGQIVKSGEPKTITLFFKKHCKKCDHVGEIKEEILR